QPQVIDRPPVRLYVEEAKAWREYASWPPPGSKPLRLFLGAGGMLDFAPAVANGAARYTYDPADPTPSVHPPVLFSVEAKVREMSALERRPDTVSFTTAPLKADLEAIGPVSVELTVRSDRAHVDFYVCLCDVDHRGRAFKVCDGYVRTVLDGDEPSAVTIECFPTAWRFARGNAIRLIVASGAFPRYARNLGTGEPLGEGADMQSACQEILFGPEAKSALVLTRGA
ncbi:MAG TPA: CocE/NonD family hydrolase, partial [Caulobacteraceae bacterium]|nr:CocE/NonD family hydrolase [Caulobacteraceae bacterium]